MDLRDRRKFDRMQLPKFVSNYLNSQSFRVTFRKAHNKLFGVRRLVQAFLLDPDPWTGLGVLGLARSSPIPHDRDTRQPTMANLAAEVDAEGHVTARPTEVFVVGRMLSPLTARKPRMMSEPLGPEDYELGVYVPPYDGPVDDMKGLWKTSPRLNAHMTGTFDEEGRYSGLA